MSNRVLIPFQDQPSARLTLRNVVSHFGKSRQNLNFGYRNVRSATLFRSIAAHLALRQSMALFIFAQVADDIPEYLISEINLIRCYSLANAATGSSCAAFCAGKKPKTIPIRLEQTKAAMMDVVE